MEKFGITPHLDYHNFSLNIISRFGNVWNHFLLDQHNKGTYENKMEDSFNKLKVHNERYFGEDNHVGNSVHKI